MYIMDNEEPTKKKHSPSYTFMNQTKMDISILHVQHPCKMIFSLGSWSTVHSTISGHILPKISCFVLYQSTRIELNFSSMESHPQIANSLKFFKYGRIDKTKSVQMSKLCSDNKHETTQSLERSENCRKSAASTVTPLPLDTGT